MKNNISRPRQLKRLIWLHLTMCVKMAILESPCIHLVKPFGGFFVSYRGNHKPLPTCHVRPPAPPHHVPLTREHETANASCVLQSPSQKKCHQPTLLQTPPIHRKPSHTHICTWKNACNIHSTSPILTASLQAYLVPVYSRPTRTCRTTSPLSVA